MRALQPGHITTGPLNGLGIVMGHAVWSGPHMVKAHSVVFGFLGRIWHGPI